jgi:hypothetical protein
VAKAAAQLDPTSTSPVTFDVTFSEPVIGFATGDVTLSGTAGAATATVTPDPLDAAHYTVAATGMSTGGTVGVSVGPSAATSIATGQASLASNLASVTYIAAAPGAPTVTINQGAAQADPTGSSPIDFDVVFSEDVTGFATGDVALSGTAPGALTGIVSALSASTYTVSVSGMTGSGTVVAAIPTGVALSLASVANLDSTSTDNTVTYVLPAHPTVTIDQAAGQPDPTSISPILFTAVFSEAVTGFAPEDIVLSGTAGATSASISGAGPTYTVTVSGMTGSGTVIASIEAGAALSVSASLSSDASTSTDNIVTFQLTTAPPTTSPPTTAPPTTAPPTTAPPTTASTPPTADASTTPSSLSSVGATGSGTSLASTGSNSAEVLRWGFALASIGAALVALAGRRRVRRH